MRNKQYILMIICTVTIYAMEQDTVPLNNKTLENFVQEVYTHEMQRKFNHNGWASSKNCRRYLACITQTNDGEQAVLKYIEKHGSGLESKDRCGLVEVLFVVDGKKVQNDALQAFKKAVTTIKKRRLRTTPINH